VGCAERSFSSRLRKNSFCPLLPSRVYSSSHVRRGVLRSVPELITAIDACMTQRNATPHPIVWTKTAQAIWTKVNRPRSPGIRQELHESLH
jgi:hypothetical protein